MTPYLESGKLVRLLVDWTPPFPGFHLYYPSRRQMRPVLSAFLTTVRQHRSGA
ncbi:LysR substrate-binding domain-containing protein [Rhizobium leguminosarum]|uniref:LysR substrate-binding domain-containing protein n=1 Tax=Rhizobium leguminosarum TaxID=384 RepID=UPI003D04D29E